ncbi:serine hydrolase [Streptomyces anandii]|uniref:serine hydrolase n=1 Tax=Streptomyces anandii TaxID=285454 RepID=UPI0036F9820E
MPHALSPSCPKPAPPAPSVRRGRRRVLACAGALLASVTTLLSVGTAHAAPASAAPATAPAATPQGKPRVTAAVLGLDDGSRQPTLYGQDAAYDTASIIKVDILATLLLQAQDAGRHLTAQERAHAEPMIKSSDNAAANALWRQIGQATGLESANKRLGLTATKGGPGARWGLTRTTASDQIRLLRAVFDGQGTASASKTASKTDSKTASSALTEESKAYIRTLMTRIQSDQAWGVSAASGAQWALKNGWLQRNTSGLWDVNSVGRITVNGHHYLVAVLSDGSRSMDEGVTLVERTARQAIAAATAGK